MSSLLHDATKGFNDIKGLNSEAIKEVYYFDKIIIALTCLAFIAYLISFYNSRFRKNRNMPAEKQAKDTLVDILKNLKNNNISTREYSSLSSITIRDYLAQAYNFNATELTNIEVVKKLEKILSNKKIMLEETTKVLRNYDKVTFSDVDYANFEEFEKLTSISQNLVDRVLDDKRRVEKASANTTIDTAAKGNNK